MILTDNKTRNFCALQKRLVDEFKNSFGTSGNCSVEVEWYTTPDSQNYVDVSFLNGKSVSAVFTKENSVSISVDRKCALTLIPFKSINAGDPEKFLNKNSVSIGTLIDGIFSTIIQQYIDEIFVKNDCDPKIQSKQGYLGWYFGFDRKNLSMNNNRYSLGTFYFNDVNLKEKLNLALDTHINEVILRLMTQ